MAVQPIGLSTTNLRSISGLAQPVSTGTPPSNTHDIGGLSLPGVQNVRDLDGDNDNSGVSKTSRFLSALDQLKRNDPAKFAQVATQIANQLNAVAQQKSQSPDGQALTQLANGFTNAATTGDLGSFITGQATPGQHHRVKRAYGRNQLDPSQVLVDQKLSLSPDARAQVLNIFQKVDQQFAP